MKNSSKFNLRQCIQQIFVHECVCKSVFYGWNVEYLQALEIYEDRWTRIWIKYMEIQQLTQIGPYKLAWKQA